MVFPVPVPDAESVRRAARNRGHGDSADTCDPGLAAHSIYRSGTNGQSDQASDGVWDRTTGRTRLGRTDGSSGPQHTAANSSGDDRFLGPDGVDTAVAVGTCGHRSLP